MFEGVRHAFKHADSCESIRAIWLERVAKVAFLRHLLKGKNEMTSSKSLYSRCFREYELKGDALLHLQNSLLAFFLDIRDLCERNEIHYMLSGGSLLGAVRSGGFIPWDDDIDIMMLRSEYEKLRAIFQQEMGDRYELIEPLQDKYYICKQPKILKKGTTFIEIPKAGIPEHNQLFIDLFIIENVPASRLLRKLKAFIYDFSYKAASVCADYLFPSPVIEEKAKTEPELKKYYSFRKRIGSVFSHLGGMNFYLSLCEHLSKGKKYSGWMGIPSGISYEREIAPAAVYEELIAGDFCGHHVSIPKNYEVYLTNLYGKDYMQIPPEEKREYHAVVSVNV